MGKEIERQRGWGGGNRASKPISSVILATYLRDRGREKGERERKEEQQVNEAGAGGHAAGGIKRRAMEGREVKEIGALSKYVMAMAMGE